MEPLLLRLDPTQPGARAADDGGAVLASNIEAVAVQMAAMRLNFLNFPFVMLVLIFFSLLNKYVDGISRKLSNPTSIL